jgi:acyl-CoA dehydrogenase
MDFRLNADQRALAESVTDLLADRFASAARNAYDEPDGVDVRDKLWATMCQQGWLAVTVDEADGGLGLGMVDAQIVARGLGGLTVPGPWRVSTIAIEAIRLGGDAAQRERWLPGLGSGELIGTHAIEARVSFDGSRASGRLPRVEYAADADLLIVAAAGGVIGVVDLRDEAVDIMPQRQYDHTTRMDVVNLSDAPVAVLATHGIYDDVLRRATTLTAADLVGTARASLTRTVGYVAQRVQFGKPISSFQAVRHELANLHVAVTMAEQAVLYAAHAIDAGLLDIDLSVAVAKSKASAAAKLATAAMIQFHGGIGFTWEHDAHLYFKRAKRLAAAFGDAEAHRERIVELLIGA